MNGPITKCAGFQLWTSDTNLFIYSFEGRTDGPIHHRHLIRFDSIRSHCVGDSSSSSLFTRLVSPWLEYKQPRRQMEFEFEQIVSFSHGYQFRTPPSRINFYSQGFCVRSWTCMPDEIHVLCMWATSHKILPKHTCSRSTSTGSPATNWWFCSSLLIGWFENRHIDFLLFLVFLVLFVCVSVLSSPFCFYFRLCMPNGTQKIPFVNETRKFHSARLNRTSARNWVRPIYFFFPPSFLRRFYFETRFDLYIPVWFRRSNWRFNYFLLIKFSK